MLRALAAGLAAGLVAAVASGQNGQWVDEPGLGIPRQESGAARVGDGVYVVGGLSAPFASLALVQRFDLVTRTWSAVAPLPDVRDHAGVAAVGGLVYAVGGFRTSDSTIRAELFAYDPASNAWSTRAPLPEPCFAPAAVALDGKLFVFGGESASGTQRTTYAYDPSTDQWSRRADMPTAREHLNAVAVGGFAHVIGGRTSFVATAAHERYDPASDSWQTLAPLPTARSAMAMAALGDQIFCAGGEAPILHAVNEVYDVVSAAWAVAQPMKIPRHGVAAVATGDRFLAPGGGLVQGFNPTTWTDSFVPPSCTAIPASISIATGGVQSLGLHAGATHAGRTYLVLGSASGTSPGTSLDGLVVPLNADSYTTFALGSTNQGAYGATLGVLDADGRAGATLAVPAGLSPSLAGTRLDHAYVVLGPALSVVFASAAKPLTLAP